MFPIVKQSLAVLGGTVEHTERNITNCRGKWGRKSRGGLAVTGGKPWAEVGRRHREGVDLNGSVGGLNREQFSRAPGVRFRVRSY